MLELNVKGETLLLLRSQRSIKGFDFVCFLSEKIFIFVSVEIWLANFYSNNINNARQHHDQEKERHWAAATMLWFINIMTQTLWMTAGEKKKSFLSPNYSSSSTWKTFPNPNIIEIGCVLINWHFLRKFQLQNEHLALLFGSLLEIYVVGQDWLLFSWLLTMNETLNYYIFPWGGRNNGITVSLVFKPFPLFRIF